MLTDIEKPDKSTTAAEQYVKIVPVVSMTSDDNKPVLDAPIPTDLPELPLVDEDDEQIVTFDPTGMNEQYAVDGDTDVNPIDKVKIVGKMTLTDSLDVSPSDGIINFPSGWTIFAVIGGIAFGAYVWYDYFYKK